MAGIFALTKREQRVAVAIAIVLLLGVLARHFHFIRTHRALPPAAKEIASPIPSPPLEDGEAADDAR